MSPRSPLIGLFPSARVRFRRRHLVFFLLLAVTSPAYAQKVKVQHDPAEDFSRFKTYAWKRGTSAPHPGTHQLITDRIEEKLSARGFQQVSSGEVDLYVIYNVALGGDIAATSSEYAWPDWLSSGSYPTGPADVYLKGTLAVDLVDAHTGKLVWRGVATDTVEGVGERVVKKVEKAIDKLFKKFPPPKKD